VTATQVYRFRVDPGQTGVEYAVREVLLGNDQVTRGRTNAVEGEFHLYMQNGKVFVALSNLQVDLRTLTSDNAVRDQAIRKRWLESDKYPKAIFVASEVEGLPLDAVQNQPYTFRVTGDMTIHNTTRTVTFDVTATIQENALMGEGTTTLYMKDFGFEPPSIVGRTIVSDPVSLTVKGVAYLIQD
jgi:polyisoprenoid-binding protein YceI